VTRAACALAIIDALELPDTARVDHRIAKKLLIESGGFHASDKHRINESIEDLHWIAAMKPSTIGVPAYRDSVREYLEISVVVMRLRKPDPGSRVTALIHRAIPYPLLLITQGDAAIDVSVAHKRHAQNEVGRVVIDGAVIQSHGPPVAASAVPQVFRLTAQPRTDLLALYQGWVECVEALQASHIIGSCVVVRGDAARARREALDNHARLTRQLAQLRSQASKEKQVARQVELNLEIKQIEQAIPAAKEQM
jgi:hypothetical protein